MSTPRRWLQSLLGIGLLAILLVVILVLRQNRTLSPPTVQEQPVAIGEIVQAPDSPLPTEEIIVITPPPDGSPIILPPATPGQIYVFPSPTPIPTWTPLPTPTRRPGPTATALPRPTIAGDARGIIRYAINNIGAELEERKYFFLTTDANGNAESAPQPISIPENLGFTPAQIVVSHDQQYAVYMQPVEPGGRPYVHNNTTGHTSALFENYSGGSFFGWHPDGRRFLFWIYDVGLWLVDAETLDMVTLSYPVGPVQGATISPNGLTIAYIADNYPAAADALWLVSTAGSDAQTISIEGEALYLYRSAWAPDSERLLYYGVCKTEPESSEAAGLCVFNVKTQEWQSLELPYTGFAPVWSPDGRHIAATGLTPGEQECQPKTPEFHLEKCLYQGRSIYIIDMQTRKASILTSGIAPIWSPDGSMLAFLSNRTGSPEIWVFKIDMQDGYQLTTEGKSIIPNSLSWKPEVK